MFDNPKGSGVRSILEYEQPTVQGIEFVVAPASELDEGYSLYQEHGGSLPRTRYEQFLAIRDALQEEKGEAPETRQVLFMVRHAGSRITYKDIFLYRYFRRMMRSENEGSSQNSEQPFQRDVYNLSDQELLAEIFLMKGKLDDYKRFTSAYPHIFENGGYGFN